MTFRRSPLIEWTVLGLALLGCAALIFLPSRSYVPIQGIAPFAQAGVSSSEASAATPKTVTLPQDWRETESTALQRQYQIEFERPVSSETRFAIYVPVVSQHARFYLNGEWLGQSGELTPQLSRHHNEPQWLEFSANRLLDVNRLEIEVSAPVASQGLLSPVYVGPASALIDSYRWKQFIRVDWVKWCTMTMYLMSFILALFWVNRRKETVYGIFAAVLFIWATHNLNLFVHRIPVSHRIWEAMTMATLGWTVVAILFFDFRFLNRPSPRVEKLMWGYSLAGLLFFLMPKTEWILFTGYSVWDGCLILLGNYSIVYLMHIYRHENSFDAWLLMMAGIPILLAGFHDILLVNGWWPRTDGLFIQYSVIPTGLLFSWFLLRRFIESLQIAENHAQQLTIQVAEKEQQLREQFAQLKDMELQRLLNQERDRLMRDMHDGIGGQLLALKSSLQQHDEPWVPPFQTQVAETLADFRLVINSLDELVKDLPSLLGQMRPRLQSLVDAAGVQLNWQVGELNASPTLTPEHSLNIMRIVQEAVTNAVKHANCSEITVSTVEQDGQVGVFTQDNGVGFNQQNVEEGRGLRNMEYRAKAIGANLKVASDRGCTSVGLFIAAANA